MKIQKQNIDGLSSINLGKTQELIERVQKDPGVARRLQQLQEINQAGATEQAPTSPKTDKSSKTESSKRSFCFSDGTIFKKRKLDEGFENKAMHSPTAKSDVSTESDWSDSSKNSKINLMNKTTQPKGHSKPNKQGPGMTKGALPFSSLGAFSKCKINRQAI